MKIKLMPMLVGALVFGAAATPLAVNAQPNSSGQQLLAQAQQRQRQGKEGKWAQLNLTEAQQQEMRRIKEETRAQMQNILTPAQQAALNANGQERNRKAWKEVMSSLSDAQKTQMRTLMQQQKNRMEAVLTDAQRQQIQQMRQGRQQRGQQWRNQRQQGN